MIESSAFNDEVLSSYHSNLTPTTSHLTHLNLSQDDNLSKQFNNFSTPHSKHSQNSSPAVRITSNHYTDIDEAVAESVDNYGPYRQQESGELGDEENNLIYANDDNWDNYRDRSDISIMESDLESDTVEDDYVNDDIGVIISKAEVARMGNAYRRSLSGGAHSSGSSGGMRVASIGSSTSDDFSVTRNMSPAEIAQHHFKLAQKHLEAAQRATMQVALQNSIQAQEYSTTFESTHATSTAFPYSETNDINHSDQLLNNSDQLNSNYNTPRSSLFPRPSPLVISRDSPPLSPPLSARSIPSPFHPNSHILEPRSQSSRLNRSTSRGYRKPVPRNLLSDGTNFEVVTSALNDLSKASTSSISLSTPSTPTSSTTSWKDDTLTSKFSSTTISVEGSRSTDSISNSELPTRDQVPFTSHNSIPILTSPTGGSNSESRSGSGKFSFFSRGKSSSRPNSNSSLQTPPRSSPSPKISSPIFSSPSPPRSTKTSPVPSRPSSVHSVSTTHSNSKLSSSMKPKIRFLSPSPGSDKSETSSLDIREYTAEERVELGRKRDEARKAMQESFKMLM